MSALPPADPGLDRHAPPTSMPAPRAPSRLLAFFLSLFSTGTGQFYVGRRGRAVAWVVFGSVGFPLLAAILCPAAHAGLFLVAAPFAFLPMVARPLSALDVAQLAPGSGKNRPGAVAVALWFLGGLVLITGSAVVTRALVVEAFHIPSGGMLPSIAVGDHVFVDKLGKKLRRGHALVFQSPENPDQDFVKRVVGLAGDRIEMRDGFLWLNGREVPHCDAGRAMLPDGDATHEGNVVVESLDGSTYLTFRDASAIRLPTEGPWMVKDGEVFVLGDNRDNSHDSRRWFAGAGGGVPIGNVKGEPFVIYLSEVDGKVDWRRLGLVLDTPTLPRGMERLSDAVAKCVAELRAQSTAASALPRPRSARARRPEPSSRGEKRQSPPQRGKPLRAP